MLLTSSLPNEIQHEELFEKHFEQIVDFMDEDNDIALRVSAARAATALVEWEKDYMKVVRREGGGRRANNNCSYSLLLQGWSG
jgi:hypothetical protein